MLSSTILLIGLTAGANPKESPADLAAWIDARLEASWRAKGLPAREVAGDEVFLRRAYLELNGTIPSVAEAREFLDSTSISKREQLVHTLLDDKRFPEHYARVWSRTMAPAGNNTRAPLEMWLKAEFRKNTPVNQIARDLLTASGDAMSGAAGFYFAVGNSPERVAEAVGRSLFGVRLGCAQCHNHPFSTWTQEDFWGLAAFFGGTGRSRRKVDDADVISIRPMDGKKEYFAKFLEGPAAEVRVGTVAAGGAGGLARDVGEPLLCREPCQSRVAGPVRHGTGFDDRRPRHDSRSEERKEILDELAAKFAANEFNLRWLIEGICLSKAYQRASIANVAPGTARRPVRTLSPDQLFASIDQALGLKKGRGLQPAVSPRRGDAQGPTRGEVAARRPPTSRLASRRRCCS